MEKKTTRHWFSWQNFNQVLDRKKPYYRKPVHTVPCVPGYEGTEAWNLLFLVVLRWGVEKVCIFSGSKTAFLGKPNCFFFNQKSVFFIKKKIRFVFRFRSGLGRFFVVGHGRRPAAIEKWQ